MTIKLNTAKAYDRPRDFSTFAAYPQLPPISHAQLGQWLTAVRVQPISAIEWDWSERWSVGPRVINDSMWFWFASGHGWGWIGSEKDRFQIREGDLMLIPQGALHIIGQDAGEHMHLVAVHFYAQVFGGINLLDLLGFPAHVPGDAEAPYGTASSQLAREYAVKAPGWSQAMSAHIYNVLLHIIRHHGSAFRIPGGMNAHPELPRLLPALELIDEKLADASLAVRDLAARVFLSEVQFRKLFRRVTGMSPIRFIQRQRIERACTLLRTSEMSVERIAEACGFSDPPFFNRIFKSWTEVPPGLYRRAKEL